MIYLIMLIFLLIIGDLWLVHKWYKWEKDRDEQDQDERILILEKRLEDYRKEANNRISMEIQQRQILEELTNNEIARINKKLKKKSDKE